MIVCPSMLISSISSNAALYISQLVFEESRYGRVGINIGLAEIWTSIVKWSLGTMPPGFMS